MSPKRSDGKMCPGVTKGGNPCKNYWNDNDPDGFCSHCRRRVQAAAKAKKNEERRLAKAEVVPAERQLDYDPEKTVICAARPDCGKEMVMGSEGTPECVKTVNPSKMAEVTRITRGKRSPLEEKQFALAKAFQSRLLTLKDGGGPFPVCPDCRSQLMRFFGRDDIFLDFSYAQRKYKQRKDEEAHRQQEAEAKIQKMSQEAEEQRLRREEQEHLREQKLLSQADAFMVGMDVESGDQKEEDQRTPSANDLSRQWARDLFDGLLDENNCPPVFLPKVDAKDVHVCSNPHCSERGTMADVARDEDDKVILINRAGEDIPLPKMWISWQPMRIVHKQGNLKGQVVLDDKGKPVVKNKPVVLCSRCGNILRGVPRKDERDAWTTPLSVAVEKAVAKKYERDAERYESGNTNGGKKSQNQRGRGFKARNSFSFGHADSKDVQVYADGNGRKAAIATFGEVADSKRRYNC